VIRFLFQIWDWELNENKIIIKKKKEIIKKKKELKNGGDSKNLRTFCWKNFNQYVESTKIDGETIRNT